VAKFVSLKSGRVFATVTSAKQYFCQILSSRELKEEFSKDDLAEIRAVYQDYCAATDWKPLSPPRSFYPTHDRGPGYTTRCFGVTFEDGTTGNFSMDKALREIAT
jgi:hypothetical protein